MGAVLVDELGDELFAEGRRGCVLDETLHHFDQVALRDPLAAWEVFVVEVEGELGLRGCDRGEFAGRGHDLGRLDERVVLGVRPEVALLRVDDEARDLLFVAVEPAQPDREGLQQEATDRAPGVHRVGDGQRVVLRPDPEDRGSPSVLVADEGRDLLPGVLPVFRPGDDVADQFELVQVRDDLWKVLFAELVAEGRQLALCFWPVALFEHRVGTGHQSVRDRVPFTRGDDRLDLPVEVSGL